MLNFWNVNLAQMKISKAGTADIPQLVNLVNRSYRGETSRQGWTTEADLFTGNRIDEAALGSMMALPSAVIFKYIDNAELLGCVYLKRENASLYLGMLTVLPLHQDKGIGKQLLRHAEVYAREQECDRIYMRVIESRTELINWYARHGYRLTDVRFPYPGDSLSIPRQEIAFAVLEKHFSSSKGAV
jgi:ribosomal protein S18 acetylase RimI-like enzyme